MLTVCELYQLFTSQANKIMGNFEVKLPIFAAIKIFPTKLTLQFEFASNGLQLYNNH